MGLTPKQDRFAMAYVETGNASEAYRLAYDAENMRPASVNRCAKALLDNIKITSRIEELRGEVRARHDVTVDSLLAELEEARALAFETGKAAAAVSASMGKARLLGLLVEKQEVAMMQPPTVVVELSGE